MHARPLCRPGQERTNRYQILMLISHIKQSRLSERSYTPVRGVILKYFSENHTLCVKFEPNWTRCKQLEEGIKSLACGSWFYPFLSLFANSFNLERYSSRGGQEKPLGWRLGVFLDHHSMNILINTPRSNKILPRVLPKYSRLRLEYFGRTLGSILLLLGVFISNFTIVWFSLKYFRQYNPMVYIISEAGVPCVKENPC